MVSGKWTTLTHTHTYSSPVHAQTIPKANLQEEEKHLQMIICLTISVQFPFLREL